MVTLYIAKDERVMQQASQALLHTLNEYIWEDEAEGASVILTKQLLLTYPDIWLRSCGAGHITGSGLVVDSVNKQILLLHHRKLNLWLQMGGHGEGELEPSLIALREVIEESGLTDVSYFPDCGYPTLIDVDAHRIPARRDEPEHYHLDFRYLFYTRTPEKVQCLKVEANELRWYSFAEIPTLPLKAATLRLIHKAEKLL